MNTELSLRSRSSVRVFRVLLTIVGIIYLIGFGLSLFYFPQVWGPMFHPENPRMLIMNISIFLNSALTCLIYVLIIFQLFRLLSLINKDNPFSYESPKRIRKVAYYTFAMATTNALLDSVRTIVTHGFSFPSWPNLTSFLLRGIQTVLFGLGILIIAFVLEVGVQLQQDQRLTV